MGENNNYIKFEDIPETFYDHTTDSLTWENDLISSMIELDKKRKIKLSTQNLLGKPQDLFGRSEEKVMEDHMGDWEKKVEEHKKNAPKREKELKEKREDPDRINYDMDFREFLYNKGIEIPTQEMDREFYLRERLSSDERSNLIKIINGFSGYLVSQRMHVPYAVLGIGTSVFTEEYFDKLEKKLVDEGFNKDSKVIEGAKSIAEQGIHHTNWRDYVEYCFNVCPSFDGKYRPISKERFDERRSKEQPRYTKEKKLGDILDSEGEDLDFVICLEELYGESIGTFPTANYWGERVFII